MKYGLEIRHLPTGQEFNKDSVELTEKQVEVLQEVVEKVAGGKMEYLMIEQNDGSKMYFPSTLLKDCVITLFQGDN